MGGRAPVYPINIEGREMAYKLVSISENTYQMEVYDPGIVVLPDRMYEAALQKRAAEKAMVEVCLDREPRISSLEDPSKGRVSTKITFQCIPQKKAEEKPDIGV